MANLAYNMYRVVRMLNDGDTTNANLAYSMYRVVRMMNDGDTTNG